METRGREAPNGHATVHKVDTLLIFHGRRKKSGAVRGSRKRGAAGEADKLGGGKKV